MATETNIGIFEYFSPEERRQELLRPPFLPTMAQIISAFPEYLKDDTIWFNFISKVGFHDLLNEEYIDTFANYLMGRAVKLGAEPNIPITILEVGAGNGRLAHFIRPRLHTGLVTYIATDSGSGGLKHLFPEEPLVILDYEQALATFKPNLVICEWMPYREDWTAAFRTQQTVKEYILIGETGSGCCGDPLQTWGNRYFDESLVNENHPYVKDGFKRVDLEGTGWSLLSHIDYSPDEPLHSKTVSFRKKQHLFRD